MKIGKCKISNLVDDLVEIFDVAEIKMDYSGGGLAVADALREKGVKVREKKRKTIDIKIDFKEKEVSIERNGSYIKLNKNQILGNTFDIQLEE